MGASHDTMMIPLTEAAHASLAGWNEHVDATTPGGCQRCADAHRDAETDETQFAHQAPDAQQPPSRAQVLSVPQQNGLCTESAQPEPGETSVAEVEAEHPPAYLHTPQRSVRGLGSEDGDGVPRSSSSPELGPQPLQPRPDAAKSSEESSWAPASPPHSLKQAEELLAEASVANSSRDSLDDDAAALVHSEGSGPDEALQAAGQEDIEAVEQAELGSIVVDTDDAGSNDAGYGSEAGSTASTSLSGSVRDFAFENGRRYHKFREGRYNFPNDDVEQEREDMKHAMVKMLCQQLHFAPIGSHPQEILDMGTGTGAWAIEMGDMYESSNILGVDLSPIQPSWVPANVRFIVDDVESSWLYPPNHFDYIHSRHTVMAIKDWPRLFHRAKEHLRPGGWIELQEISHFPLGAESVLHPGHPVAQYWGFINQGLRSLGVNLDVVSGGVMADMMRAAGFVNVTERVFQVPVGTWPKNKVLKTVGLYWRTILLDGIQAIALGPLTRGCGWSRQEVELFLVRVRMAYYDNASTMFMPLYVVYGQRPELAPDS